MNGHIFHDDAAKSAEFDQLEPLFQGFVQTNVNALLIKGLNVLAAERNLIRQAFDRGAIELSP